MQFISKSICIVVAAEFANCAAVAQDYSIKSKEHIQLMDVYWVGHECRSLLKSFRGIDKLEGPSEVSLSLKPAMVYARRQNCGKRIKGAHVVVSAGTISAHHQATLTFRVRYNTADGERQSTHTVTLDMYP